MKKVGKAISVTNLHKSFKDIKVLDGITFSVDSGNIFALLGSNGAGKTTTIKILTTLLKPDSGEASVQQFDVVKQPEKIRTAISLTGQFAAVDDILSGRENMEMIGKLRHLSDVKQKASQLLEQFDLTEAADRHVSTYSGGMRRRLDLAMSLLGSPSVVFLDEPTTGLDPMARTIMWQIIKDLARNGVTVFLTTQYLEEADQLADYIAILHKGKIVADGSATELKKLLPQGHIELRFHDEVSLSNANKCLQSEFSLQQDIENLSLSVVTDGSVKQITMILSRLDEAGIPVSEFSQKQPSLDDVFMSIITTSSKEESR